MRVSIHKNRFFFAIIPTINIYKSWWLVELNWINITINIKIINK